MSITLGFAAAGAALAVQAPPAPLFADDAPLALTIEAPVTSLARAEGRPSVAGTMTVAPGGERLAVRIEPRGITRRDSDVCQFPPLRVTLDAPPPAGSPFAGQRRLKLVTHCRANAGFQQYVLLEYAAYRLYNLLTPASFRVRLARIGYRDGKRDIAPRLSFFIEDIGGVAARNAMIEPAVGERFPVTRLSPTDAARFAIFNYMIGNLDWAMQAGPPGDDCCHNSRPIAPSAAAAIVPVPYDFDFSGLVSAPYAKPPEMVPVKNVRERRYRGLCRHNAEARALFPAFRTIAPQARATLASLPELDPSARARAQAFLDQFFATIADDARAERDILGTCLGQA